MRPGWLSRHPTAGSVLGGLLAGVGALAAGVAGVPAPYPYVVGLSVALPLLVAAGAEAGGVEAYVNERGSSSALLDGLLIVGAGLIVGAAAAFAAGLGGVQGALHVGFAIAGTVVGGYAALAVRLRAP